MINGYTWRSGWFIDENSRGGNGDDYLVFSADGVTTNGYGIPDTTLATNRSETRADTKGTWDSEDRPNGIGDDVVFDFNQEMIVITFHIAPSTLLWCTDQPRPPLPSMSQDCIEIESVVVPALPSWTSPSSRSINDS